MPRIYCGNNHNHPKLTSGTHVIGTNYQCLRKGIGLGYNQPYDAKYETHYIPIDQRRFYCGVSGDIVPPHYFANGSPSKCLQKGVGIGKARRVERGRPLGMNFIRYYLPWILFLLIAGGVFLGFYLGKPKFLMTKKSNDTEEVNWKIFFIYYVLCCTNIFFIIWWFWIMFVRRWI